MKIKNYNSLAVTPLRADILAVIDAGLAAIDTGEAVRRAVRRDGDTLCIGERTCSLHTAERVVLIGVGKCTAAAAAALEPMLGDRLERGIVLGTAPAADVHFKRIEYVAGSHPIPTDENVEATRRILDLLSGLSEQDIVIAVISGGGSTLLCQPASGTCAEEALVLDALTRGGADITAINTVRKHLSAARGGGLARAAYPARVVSLIFSDVPGDDLGVVASGPTVRDTTTVEDARAILRGFPEIFATVEPMLIETPKEEKYFENVENILLVSSHTALDAMGAMGTQHSYTTTIVTAELAGEARDIGAQLAAALRAASAGTLLLYGGETTVTMEGAKGRGGRNAEVCLAALPLLGEDDIIAAVASDGNDNGDVAGALCDTLTRERAAREELDTVEFLARHDSHTFFERVESALVTGPTGANVADLLLAAKKPSS